MNETQAKQLIRRIAILFPDWADWYAQAVTEDTETAWLASLQTQDYADADQVVCDWQLGKRKCPETFERERVIYMLVEAARMIRNNRYTKLESERVRENATPTPEQIRERREAYRPIAAEQTGMGNAMRRILTAAPKGKPRWEWTRQEEIDYIVNLNRVAAEYAKELGLPKPEPIKYMHEQRAAAAKRQQPEPQPREEFYAWQGGQ